MSFWQGDLFETLDRVTWNSDATLTKSSPGLINNNNNLQNHQPVCLIR